MIMCEPGAWIYLHKLNTTVGVSQLGVAWMRHASRPPSQCTLRRPWEAAPVDLCGVAMPHAFGLGRNQIRWF